MTFNSRNSNYEKAKQMSKLTIRKLKKQKKLQEFQAKIQEKIDIGTLQQVPHEDGTSLHSGVY